MDKTYLGVSLDDGETTSSVRFLGIRPEEIGGLFGDVVVLWRSWAIALRP